MTGEILVRWAPAAVWRPGPAGRGLPVTVDGVRVAEIAERGGVVRLPLAPGSHTVRVGASTARSNAVTVEAAEGGLQRLEVRRPWSGWWASYLAGCTVGAATVHTAPLVGVALFAALEGIVLGIPGVSWRLRACLGPRGAHPASAEAAEDRWVDSRSANSAANGLWWESDPRFARRFGRDE